MDDRAFDRLTRRVAGVTSRRALVRAAVGASVLALGSGAYLSEVEDATAQCGGAGTRCNRDVACCSGACAWTTVQRGRVRQRIGTCTPPPTATPTVTGTPTALPTDTPTGTPTSLPTATPTITPTATPTCSLSLYQSCSQHWQCCSGCCNWAQWVCDNASWCGF